MGRARCGIFQKVEGKRRVKCVINIVYVLVAEYNCSLKKCAGVGVVRNESDQFIVIVLISLAQAVQQIPR